MDLSPSSSRQDAFKSAKSFQRALRESHAAPEDHRLPWYVIWGITLLIPVLVACVNFLMVMADLFLMNWKFRVTQEARESSSGDSILVLLGISVSLAGCAALLVFIAPSCAGSGIPEAKGYLNGNEVPSFLDMKCFLVRAAALVLAVAAGFPVGREGPMLCLGGCLGMGVAKSIAAPYMKTWIEVETESSSITAKMVTEKQLGYVLRMSFILGGAAGIATAFRAPVGAVLYLFEEVTVSAWSIEFTLRAFVCTVLAAITSFVLLDVTGFDIHRLLIYDGTVPQPRDWQWQDVPFFILLAILAGVISALFTRGLLTCWRLRQTIKKFQEDEGWCDARSKSFRFMEVVCYAALCALLFGAVPGLTPCLPGLDSSNRLVLVRYDCEEGYYNEVASLLLSGAEGATKDLFSREVLHLTTSSVAITLCVYLPLAMGVAGLTIPMGAFVPNMLLGALVGRLFGGLLESAHLQESWGLAHPGVYALVGSGAMLGGFTQMTVAVVVMLVEAVSDLSVVSPLMLGISVARVVSGFINRHAYDEELVIRKGIPFLEPEPPSHHVEALQIYQKHPLPKAALLPVHCSEGVAAAALRVDAPHYPVIDENHICVGVISRTLLQRTDKAMLRARGSKQRLEVEEGDILPLSDIMDLTPEVVRADTPLLRIWSLFIHGRAEKVVIISHHGTFQGLISRPSLIEAMQHVESKQEEVKLPAEGSETTRSAKSRSAKLSQPRTHNLPNYIIWAVTFITAGLVGVVNFLMVTVDSQLVSWKFDSMQQAMDYNGAFLGAVTLSAICGLFAALAAALVVFIAPICAGSGLPEAKSYLNGNFVPNMFEPRNFLVRVLGIVLSTAAGFPIGREGPMVCIGGILGIGVMHVFALPFLRRWVDVGTNGKRPALLIEDDRFRHAKRIGCVLGGAAGIATAFSAPIGAILYMLEEVTVIAWSPELTFRTFVATTFGALVTRFCLNFSGFDIDRLVIYERAFQGQKDWNWMDLPFFILVASIMGAVAAAFTQALVFTFTFRQRWRKERPWLQRPLVRIAEAALLAMLIALVFGLIPSLFECEEGKWPKEEHQPRILLSEQSYEVGGNQEDTSEHHEALYFVKYTCKGESFFNQAATLLLSGEEGVVKHLYSRAPDSMSIPPLLVALLVYVPFAASMAGLSVPMGVFIPSMVIGAISGRIIGEVVSFLDLNLAHPGVYSLIGSVAMLSGFTQMTLAIVMLLVEATLDLELVAPLMLSSFVARVVASMLVQHAYDEQLIMKKGHAFLDAELPDAVNGSAVKAVDLLQPLPKEAVLQFSTAVQDVQKALAKEEVVNFPVVEGGQCIGLVTRLWLHSVLRARTLDREELYRNPLAETNAWKRWSDDIVRLVLGERLEIDEAEGDGFLSMVAIMDTGAYTILEDTPLGRFYHLFTRAGLNTACVISTTGEFRGILSKADIITYLSKVEENHQKKHPKVEATPAMTKSTRKAKRPPGFVSRPPGDEAQSDAISPEDITVSPSPKVLGNVNEDMECWVDARQVLGILSSTGSRRACCPGPWSYPN